jgi:signal transduction histidine kinase
MRALIFELRPESLALEGLVGGIEKHAAALRARHAIEVSVSLCDEPDIPLEVKEALSRTAQEAMHNIGKHAQATAASVKLKQVDSALILEISDNGRGFDTSAGHPGHLGLVSMRERAAKIGGELAVVSQLGVGTSITVTVVQ